MRERVTCIKQAEINLLSSPSSAASWERSEEGVSCTVQFVCLMPAECSMGSCGSGGSPVAQMIRRSVVRFPLHVKLSLSKILNAKNCSLCAACWLPTATQRWVAEVKFHCTLQCTWMTNRFLLILNLYTTVRRGVIIKVVSNSIVVESPILKSKFWVPPKTVIITWVWTVGYTTPHHLPHYYQRCSLWRVTLFVFASL